MRELMLLRHGKSDWRVDVDDYHRPLRDRGKRAAQQIGNWLKEQDSLPDVIISSSAERAYATADKACRAMGLDARHIIQNRELYLTGVQQHLSILANIEADHKRVLLVGHNPGMEELLQYLVAPTPQPQEDGKIMPTATLAKIDLPDDWSNLSDSTGRLTMLLRPKELPDNFVYDGDNGQELRPRPAYYYTQSALIPYRIKDSNLQILIIRSSGNKHWVLPKGIVDPGLTPQASAQKEAWEEAGVTGVLDEEEVGHFYYTKWQGNCYVSVYSLQVNMQEKKEARRSIREAHWVSVEDAIAKLKSLDLAKLVKQFATDKGYYG